MWLQKSWEAMFVNGEEQFIQIQFQFYQGSSKYTKNEEKSEFDCDIILYF